ncbi:lysophospholipid acyltransferase family protein [Sphingomonas sp. VNH70]|uniref:lysophospholipid acyltransferase family protein n=1 Tax=Sphingomonas silueang TaxID=3156617 RepID=UPI0032B53340
MLRTVAFAFGRGQVTGRHHLPDGPAIIVANHVGWLDPLWIGTATWPRPVYFMAKRELFVPVMGTILRSAGVFPVDRDAPGPSAMKLPLAILAGGGLLVIFPGGRRSEALGDLKRGAATIAMLAGCPLVPVHYAGPTKLQLRDLLRRPPVRVRFHAPILPPPREGRRMRDAADTLSQAIEKAINSG